MRCSFALILKHGVDFLSPPLKLKNMENLIGCWPNLSRAYEIALLGKLSIRVVFDKEYISGFEDYELIKEFFSAVKFSSDGEITVEITKPEPNSRAQLSDIDKRVSEARKNDAPLAFKNDACQALMKTAIQRLNLSVATQNNIVKIARIIAQLSGTPAIYTEHMAEAIHYNIPVEQACIAENKSIKFGGIEIPLHELSPYDIENAVKYLQSL